MRKLSDKQFKFLELLACLKSECTYVLPEDRRTADALEKKGLVFVDRLAGLAYLKPAGRQALNG